MKIESISFISKLKTLVVEYRPVVGERTFYDENELIDVTEPVYGDIVQVEYSDRKSYLADFPYREADCNAMGWL